MKKGNRVRFNVGGRIFETTATTLAAAGPDSFFGPLLTDNWNTNTTTDDEVFIDRNPDCFAVILDILRTGELSIPPHVSKDSLIREAQYYGVLELVRCASWGSPLNGDLALLSSSVKCRAKPKAAEMIFGSPNGGFCVANDTSVHVYDWMLHEQPPIHILDDYGKVISDALWVGTNNIAIATTKTITMFDAVTGKLKHKFVDQKGNQVYGGTSMCLNDSSIFYLRYRSTNGHTTIGMLNLESGKLTDSFSLCVPTYSPGIYDEVDLWTPINLQMVDGSSNYLLATHVLCRHYGFPKNYSIEANIIDTRDTHSVYNRSWSSRNYNHNNNDALQIRGATLMEDRNSICVINYSGAIGFLDLRFTGDIQWGSNNVVRYRTKLVYQNDRIFMLSEKSLLVYSVPDIVMTSETLRNDVGDYSIVDFSISGDRLFTLQRGTNLVQVWETPRPCVKEVCNWTDFL